MKRFATLSLLVFLIGVMAPNPPPAAAADISFESRTYVPATGIDGGDDHVLFYEYLSLDADNLGPQGLYVRAGGWGRVDLADETRDEKTNGDLQYGFIGWRGQSNNAEARLGRISFTGGAARNEVFDGALFGTDLPAGFDVTLFGGVPDETRQQEGSSGDSLYGGRISQGRAGSYRIGASYLKEENDSNTVREEACADLFLAPLPRVEVAGSSLYDLDGDGWAQHDYRLTLGPFAERVRLTGTWVWTDYEHYFQGTTNDAFDEVDAHEKLNRIGAEIEFELGHGMTLTGEYVNYAYDIADSSDSFGVRLDWAGGGRTAGAGYRKVDGSEEENRYQEFRAYATTPIGPVAVSAGIEHLSYDEDINGESSATTGTLTLGYKVSRALEVSASAEYGVTPDFEHEANFMLAVLWRYDAETKKGGKP